LSIIGDDRSWSGPDDESDDEPDEPEPDEEPEEPVDEVDDERDEPEPDVPEPEEEPDEEPDDEDLDEEDLDLVRERLTFFVSLRSGSRTDFDLFTLSTGSSLRCLVDTEEAGIFSV